MPVFSDLTPFGLFEFDSGPSEAERVLDALVASYRDPKSGQATIDFTVGYQEAKLYGWAIEIGGVRVHLRAAGLELKPETSYALLESHELRYGMKPAPTDAVNTRRAALLARRAQARGPRYEAIQAGLANILGSAFVGFRSMTTAEAERFPNFIAQSPGNLRRNDLIAKTVRITDSIARPGDGAIADSYAESNQDSTQSLNDVTTRLGTSFLGDGRILSRVIWYLARSGNAYGALRSKIYVNDGTGRPSVGAQPLATSEAIPASALSTSLSLVSFYFPSRSRIFFPPLFNLVATIERDDGQAATTVLVGVDGSAPGHTGGNSTYSAVTGLWTATSAFDACFYVRTGYGQEVSYESWDTRETATRLVAGDVVAVDPGNLGLAERVEVYSADGDGEDRKFTAFFNKTHDAGTLATTGTTPIWSNTKRHLLIFATAAAAENRSLRERIDDLLRRVLRAPTTWSIVEPTTPGVTTSGPFKLGASPLGAVPAYSTVIAP